MSLYKLGVGTHRVGYRIGQEKPETFTKLGMMLFMGLFLYGYALGARR